MKQEFPLEVDARAFLLRPDTPPEGIPRPDQQGAPLSGHLGADAQDLGLEMRRPGITSYTRLALEASEYAKGTGLFDPFHRALYRAFWSEGKDLGKLEVLRDVGEAVGLDGGELVHHLEVRTFKDAVEAQYSQALQLGVNAIPAFVFWRYLFMGAQPYEVFQRIALHVQGEISHQGD